MLPHVLHIMWQTQRHMSVISVQSTAMCVMIPTHVLHVIQELSYPEDSVSLGVDLSLTLMIIQAHVSHVILHVTHV